MISPKQLHGSTIIRSVDAGYAVEHRGETLVVEKGGPVFRAHEVFMEHGDYESLKNHPDLQNFVQMNL